MQSNHSSQENEIGQTVINKSKDAMYFYFVITGCDK
jgi:hypothetical protein